MHIRQYEIALVVASSLVFYTWLGYPTMLWVLRHFVRHRPMRRRLEPVFSIIVAVHNELAHITGKLEGCLALEYPADRMEIIVASDGSTDGTEQIVQDFARRDSRIRLVRVAGRAGKSGAQNLGVENASGELLLFSDAETIARPDLLRRLADNFADPRIGMVAPVVHFGRFGSAVSQGQGAYWRFELLLRQFESDLGILATCSGSAFAIRRDLFRLIPSQYGDDCITPLDIRLQGCRIIQDPEIIVYDQMPHSIEGELRARIRMTARNWSGILSRPRVLNPLRFPGTSWGLISHKFLRWMTPFFLALLFITNCALARQREFIALFILQSCFYVAALVGWRRSRSQSCERIFGYPFAFCLANVGFFLGLLKCLRGQRVVAYR